MPAPGTDVYKRQEVGHVDDCLEEGLALQLQAQVGEPGRQQQRDGDLRDEACLLYTSPKNP